MVKTSSINERCRRYCQRMGSITDMILFVGYDEGGAVGRLNLWCAENDDRGQQFEQLGTDDAGGAKVFSAEVWAMAGNYFPHEELGKALPTFGWESPENVVLIVNRESASTTQVYRAAES